MRRLLAAIALLLGIVFFITKMAEVQKVAETLRRGDWRFVLLALGVEAVWLLNVAASYRSIYRTLGIEEKIERLVLLSSAVFFVNVVAPSVGMGGVAVFLSEARRQGYSRARATVAGVLFVLFDYAGFLIILGLGLIVLVRRNNLNSAELIASAILFLVALGVGSLIYLGTRSGTALGHVLAFMAHIVNRLVHPFIHREYLSETRARAFALDAASGLHLLSQKPGNLLLPVALALSSKALLISELFLMFLAFKVPFTVGTLIAGFSIGYLFLIVSPTPSGIGIVEGALTLALVSLNVPLNDAAVITLAYRGTSFWLPLLVGIFAFRWLGRAEKAQPAPQQE